MGFIWDLSRIYPVLDLDPSLSCVHISKKKVYTALCSVFVERMSNNDFFSGAYTFRVKFFESTSIIFQEKQDGSCSIPTTFCLLERISGCARGSDCRSLR